MADFISQGLARVAGLLGYDLVPRYKPLLRAPIPAGAKLCVGCGEQEVDGYVGCDLRPLPNVQLACRAWDISEHCSELAEIYSRHMLEHLTLEESQLTLKDWYRALMPGGLVRIEVPNMDFAMKQWGRADWSAEQFNNRYSDARWGFAGFYGWQRECDPREADYNQSYWDVHKSGYTPESMQYFLTEAGFESVEIQLEGFTEAQIRRRKIAPDASDGCHLIAMARKPAQVQRKAA